MVKLSYNMYADLIKWWTSSQRHLVPQSFLDLKKHWEYGTCKLVLSLRGSGINYEFEMCLNVFENMEHMFESDLHVF